MGSIFSTSQQNFTSSDVVGIKNGKIRGKRFILKDGKEVDAYLGVPYGRPPVGELRFKKPQPADNWYGIRECTRFGSSCPFDSMFLEYLLVPAAESDKNEDCLYLNVFAPTWKLRDQSNGFTVMVWIHGGGFAIHSAANYGDENICRALCSKDVIVVTINYRLGFFGFLSTADDHSRGNYGLWDMTLALKWVRDNIPFFGGDPNNITVFGQSAGGMSADLLALSPHSQNLFQKMIPMAGTSGCTMILHSADFVREKCLQFAIENGFKLPETEDKSIRNKALVEFFYTLSSSQLAVGMAGKAGYSINKNIPDLVPVVDGDFFPRSYQELRKEMPKKICMSGVTKNEGVFFIMIRHYHYQFNVLEKIEDLIVGELKRRKIRNIEEAKKRALNIYLKDIDITSKRKLIRQYINVLSDTYMNFPTWEFADEMAKNGHTVYQYVFEYVNPYASGWARFLSPMISATHCTELPYLFLRGVASGFYPDVTDMAMYERFSDFFTNFAKYGNPNGKDAKEQVWKPVLPTDTTRHLRINFPNSIMDDHIHRGRVEQWHEILNGEKSKI